MTEQTERSGSKLISLQDRIRTRKRQKQRYFFAVLIVIAAFALLFLLLTYSSHYTNYKVSDRYTREDGGNGEFIEMNGVLVRYSSDGVVGTDRRGNELWQQSYEMLSPIISVCGDSLAISGKDANKIYVFSASGKKGEISTNYPIQSISVSTQGIVAAIMRNDSNTMLMCYSKDGEVLVESRASLSDTGYPLAAAISENGTRLLVSYLVPGERISSKVVCYEFGREEVVTEDLTIMEEYFDDLLIPTVFFLGDTGVAVGDGKMMFFRGGSEMKTAETVNFTETIVSVLHNSDRIALILRNTGEGDPYILKIYRSSGSEEASVSFAQDYLRAEMNANNIVLIRDSGCSIFNGQGREVFTGRFDDTPVSIFPQGGLNRYLVIFKESIETIRAVK